jgi:hypothetical protein
LRGALELHEYAPEPSPIAPLRRTPATRSGRGPGSGRGHRGCPRRC